MKKTVYIGNATGYGGGVFAKITHEGGRLSITGVIGPQPGGDARGSCGQIDGTIREASEAGRLTLASNWAPDMLAQFLDVWDRWHLNDMRAACEHQRAEGWQEKAREPRTVYHWRLLPEIISKQKELHAEAIDRAASTESSALGFSPEEKRIMRLEYAITTTAPELTGWDLKYYGKPAPGITAHEETKARGWLTEEEHPDGLLSKACGTCGHKYGRAWLTEEVPAAVIEFLAALPDPAKTPAWV